MHKATLTILCVLFLSITGCDALPFVYKPDVQQGNVITQAMVKDLKIGMRKVEVANAMGTPVLTDTFKLNRWEYVYTLKPTRGRFQEKRVILYFNKDGRLRKVQRL